MRASRALRAFAFVVFCILASSLDARTINADPTTYVALVAQLVPGDTLVLAPGRYGVDAVGRDTPEPGGLALVNLAGRPDAPITIEGPASGAPAVFLGRSLQNTIRLGNASWITVRNVTVDGRRLGGAGVATEGVTHHITIEGIVFYGLDGHQQIVAISCVQGPTWNWTIRGNTIRGAGTGMYLGNSDGRSPFVAGLIERNVVVDTIGYNIEVKHQVAWDKVPPGMPTDATTTVIRRNVFAKRSAVVSRDGARPNLLVGDQPPTGPGSRNRFEIYGNFFYENPTESLFQGEGNLAFHDNVLVNRSGPAIRVHRHKGLVRRVDIFHNTIVARDEGINVVGGYAGSTQTVVGNVVFAGSAPRVDGDDVVLANNTTGAPKAAADWLVAPDAALGALDLRPRDDRLAGVPLGIARLDEYLDTRVDFAGVPRAKDQRGALLRGPGRPLDLTVRP